MAMDALMIGISGMRGTIGGTLTPSVVGNMAMAFSTWLRQNRKPANGRFFRLIFGRDSRPSGSWVRDAAAAAVVASGVELIDLDIVTTPGVAMMVKHLQADGGIIATASHNPIHWNGLKFLNSDAVAPPPEDAGEIKKIYESGGAYFSPGGDVLPPKKKTENRALQVEAGAGHVGVGGGLA